MEGKSNICFSFIQHRMCKFGDSCRFQHVLESSRPCKFFQQAGLCKLGSKCSFVHTSAIPKPRAVVNDNTEKCNSYFNSGSCRFGDICRFRHYSTEFELKAKIETSDDETIGWSNIHEIVFRAEYEKLAKVLQQTTNHTTLLSSTTKAPKTINWSEFDSVDGSVDKYTIIIPAHSTPLDVAFTSSKDLQRGEAALYNLFDSTDDRNARFICATLLLNPMKTHAIMSHLQTNGGAQGIDSWCDGWTLIHECCFRGDYPRFQGCYYYFRHECLCTLLVQELSMPRVITWWEEDTSTDDDDHVDDGSHKEFKLTIPLGYTLRDILCTTSKDLDVDSPCREMSKKYLLDSLDDGENRQKLLQWVDHRRSSL